jgi:formate hydrogenlyase subunit 6/NADH:ubiquinone oxidoreductase subunit I
MKTYGRMIRQVLISFFTKPKTVLYPFVKVVMPPKFRGKLDFHPEKCICCKLCMKDCPTAAINIVKRGEKQFEAEIDLSRCIYCAQCVDSCPKDALEATGEFELASLNRDVLKVTFHAPKAQSKSQEPASHQTPQGQDSPAVKDQPESGPDKTA